MVLKKTLLETSATAQALKCTAGSTEPSHVLCAMNLPTTALRGAIRLSFSRENTGDDVDRVLDVLPGIIAKLRGLSPAWLEREAALKRLELCE